jgi:hemolysin activation/secretion protein
MKFVMKKNKWALLSALVLTSVMSMNMGTVSAAAQVKATAPTAGSTMREIKDIKLDKPIQRKPQIEITKGEQVSWPLDDQVKIKVNGFRLDNQEILSQAEVDKLLHDKIGKELTFKELNVAADKLTAYLQSHDYLVAKVYLPAQRINKGIVELSAVVGKYDQIILQNDSKIKDYALRNQMTCLKTGNYIKRSEVERAVWLLNDVASADSKVTISPGTKSGTSNVTFVVHKHKGPTGSAYVDNYGNRYTGYNEVGVNYNWLNPTKNGDTIALEGLSTGGGKNNYGMTYFLPVGKDGHRFDIGYSRLHYILGNEFDDTDSYGKSDTLHIGWRYAIRRSSRNNQYVSLRAETSRLEDFQLGNVSANKRDRGLVTSFFGDEIDPKGSTNYSVEYKWGHMGIMNDETMANDYAGPATEGSFHKLSTYDVRQQTFDQRNYMIFTFNGQIANKNLDSYEKLELGGPYGVRAYPQGEASGDIGYVASAEYRHIIPLKARPDQTLQLAAFLDNGAVRINKSNYSGGDNYRHLSGCGIGLLWGRTDDWLLRLTYAWKLGSEKYQSEEDGNGRFRVQFVKYF